MFAGKSWGGAGTRCCPPQMSSVFPHTWCLVGSFGLWVLGGLSLPSCPGTGEPQVSATRGARGALCAPGWGLGDPSPWRGTQEEDKDRRGCDPVLATAGPVEGRGFPLCLPGGRLRAAAGGVGSSALPLPVHGLPASSRLHQLAPVQPSARPGRGVPFAAAAPAQVSPPVQKPLFSRTSEQVLQLLLLHCPLLAL